MVKSYITRIQELEELARKQNSTHPRHEKSNDYLDLEDDESHSRNSYLMDSDMKTEPTDGMLPAAWSCLMFHI